MLTKKPSDLVSGILLMLLHAIAMSVVYVVGKKITGVLSPFQTAFLYKLGVLILIVPWCHFKEGGILQSLKTKKLGLHFARGVFSLAASICFYHSLKRLDVLDVSAIAYLEQIIILLIGVIYFQEQLTVSKLIFTFLGLCGAWLIIDPSFAKFNSGYLYLFLALIFWALNNCSIKLLGKTERSRAQLFYVALFGTVLSAPMVIKSDWSPFNITMLKYVIIMAIFHLIHVVSFFKAFKFADISTLMPFDYTRLIMIAILGYFFIDNYHAPSAQSIMGYLLIAAGGIYLVYDESRRSKGINKDAHLAATKAEHGE